MINTQDLNVVLMEYNTLSSKVKHTREDGARMAYLQTAIAAIRSGASLAELDEQRANDTFKRNGLPTFTRTTDAEVEARGWKSFIEQRDMIGGNPISRIGTYTGLGNFVPTGFYDDVFRQMAWYDPLFDEDSATVLKTSTGNVMTIPTAADSENVAVLTSEAANRTSVDYSSTGQITLGAYSFSSPRFVASMEAWQDVSANLNLVKLAKTFFADRISRGVGNYLINGTGSSQPTGLLHALANLSTPTIAAAGSAAQTGGTETGANSLGLADFGAALAALDNAYLLSPKTAWLMNRKTLGYLNSIVTKMGTPAGIVQYCDDKPCILGIPVKVSPSLPDIGASATPVVLGDFSYFVTRLVNSENLGLTVISEANDLVEKGNIGIVAFFRADSGVAVNDNGSPIPFVQIRCHS